MKYLHQYLWEASEAFDFLTYFWPVTLVLLLFLCSTAINYIWVEKVRFSLRHLLIFSPLLLIIGTFSVSIFLRYSYMKNANAPPPSWPSTLVDILFWVQIPLAALIGAKRDSLAGSSYNSFRSLVCLMV